MKYQLKTDQPTQLDGDQERMDISREECKVYMQGPMEHAAIFECVEAGIRPRHGSARSEFSGVRADTPDADGAHAGRVPGGAGGADGKPVAEARAQDPVESPDESRGDVVQSGSCLPELNRRLAASNPRWGAKS